MVAVTKRDRVGRVRRYVVAVCLTPSLLAAQHADTAWRTVAGGAGTRCAFDTPFHFWVHEGDPARVFVYLQGGGACWSFESCSPGPTISFDASIDSSDAVQRRDGIFDRRDSRNPFRAHTAVFVPYCTGDLHLGARTNLYRANDTSRTVVVHHAGYRNVSAVLDWLGTRRVEPVDVTIIGASAGGVASPVFAAEVARRFPVARVRQIADGASAFRVARLRDLMAGWGADSVLATLGTPLGSSGDLVVGLYKAAGAREPRIRFSQVATRSDAVVGAWLRRFGDDALNVSRYIDDTFRELSASGLCFRGYAIAGTQHTILWRTDGLAAEVSGQPLGERLQRDVLEGDCHRRSSESPRPAGVRLAAPSAVSGDAAFLFAYRAKPGMDSAFAAGYRRHLDWHAARADSLAWLAWTVVDGPSAGTFVDGTFGITFKAFDDRVDPPGDSEDAVRNVTAFAIPTGRETLRLRRELSPARRLESGRAGRMQRVVRLIGKAGAETQIERVLRAFVSGGRKTLDYAVYERVSGGEQPAYTLLVQFDAWAELERVGADPAPAIIRALGERLARVESEIWAYRPELVYLPQSER